MGKRGLIWRRWETAIVTGPIISRRKSLSDADFHKPNLTPPSSAAAIYRTPLWSPHATIMCPEGGCILCTSAFYSPKRGKAAYPKATAQISKPRFFSISPPLFKGTFRPSVPPSSPRYSRGEKEWNGIQFRHPLPSPSSNPFQLHERVAWYGRNRRREGRRTNSKRYLPPSPPSFAWGEVHIQLGWGPPPPPACFPTSERLPEAHFKLKQTLLLREAKNHSILPPLLFFILQVCAASMFFSPGVDGWRLFFLFPLHLLVHLSCSSQLQQSRNEFV